MLEGRRGGWGAEGVDSKGTTSSSSVTPPLRIRIRVTHRDIGVEIHVDADWDQDHGCGGCVSGNGHISRVVGLTRVLLGGTAVGLSRKQGLGLRRARRRIDEDLYLIARVSGSKVSRRH